MIVASALKKSGNSWAAAGHVVQSKLFLLVRQGLFLTGQISNQSIK